MKHNIFIIDDKVNICIGLSKNLVKSGYKAEYSTSGETAVERLSDFNPHCILLDLMLGGENGIDVLKQIKDTHPKVPVLIITGFASIDTAVEAMRFGAYDYIQKPINFSDLLKTIESAIQNIFKEWEPQPRTSKSNVPKLITVNPEMLAIIDKIIKLGPSDLPVLILGENGVGKEVIADLLHHYSKRRDQQMFKVNCAAFQESLLDNELFGHEKGAFTGADNIYFGVFERAHKGSLFLDEIGDMSLGIQSKILRALQNNEIRRIGGNTIINIDTRFIAATNMNIEAMIREKTFRKDLFFRLNTATLNIPPLRDRREDIPLLVSHFLEENDCASYELSNEVLETLSAYHWPGNIRELKNAIRYALTMCTGEKIRIQDLPHTLQNRLKTEQPATPMKNVEYKLILEALKRNNFNKKRTAEEIGISRKTLYNKMEKYGFKSMVD